MKGMRVTACCGVAILVALLTSRAGVRGYTGGAPILACKTLVPQHLSEPELGEPPYQILVSSWHIPPTAMHDPPIIQIMISSNEGEKFKGFIVQARCVANNTVVGRFEAEPGEYQMIDCARAEEFPNPDFFGDEDPQPYEFENTATHLEASDKTNVTLLWKAPANVSGNIVFQQGWADSTLRRIHYSSERLNTAPRAITTLLPSNNVSIVKDFDHYWTDLRSDIVLLGEEPS